MARRVSSQDNRASQDNEVRAVSKAANRGRAVRMLKPVKPADARRAVSATASRVRSAIRPAARTNRDGTHLGGYDTGNTRISGQAVAPQQGPNPADTQRQIDQGLNLLNQVRAAVQDSPEARQQLQSLIDQMRNLDPSRFPGNPALVEQMHQQLVSEVDALELQLRRQLDETQGGTIRNTDPSKVPAGYQDSVAEYYRKLSGGAR